MNKKLMGENLDSLFEAILSLETKEECACFFDDLCTIGEIKSMCQRFEVARLLDKDIIYTEIAEKTGASSATISRVNRCLNYGSGGYRAVLDKIKPEEESE